jgi:hypothetical protein
MSTNQVKAFRKAFRWCAALTGFCCLLLISPASAVVTAAILAGGELDLPGA